MTTSETKLLDLHLTVQEKEFQECLEAMRRARSVLKDWQTSYDRTSEQWKMCDVDIRELDMRLDEMEEMDEERELREDTSIEAP